MLRIDCKDALADNPTYRSRHNRNRSPHMRPPTLSTINQGEMQHNSHRYERRKEYAARQSQGNDQRHMQNLRPTSQHKSSIGDGSEAFNANPTVVSNQINIPAFTRKEEWKVWFCRFEALAARYKWDEEKRLDQLLPRLQGSAAEFVFTQLPSSVQSDYGELTQELKNRYRVIETTKTFASMFARRTQRVGETAEEYAADLKKLYDKAYPNRDRCTRGEDLLRRFIDGLHDDEARFNVEYHKEPDDIDEAVSQVVNYVFSRKSTSADGYHERRGGYRKGPRLAREQERESDDESNEQSGGSTIKPNVRNNEKIGPKHQKPKGSQEKSTESDSKVIEKRVGHIEEKLNEIIETVKNQDNRRNSKTDITCFNCRQKGHYSRDCPQRRPSYGRMDNRNLQGRDMNRDRGGRGYGRRLDNEASPNCPLN